MITTPRTIGAAERIAMQFCEATIVSAAKRGTHGMALESWDEALESDRIIITDAVQLLLDTKTIQEPPAPPDTTQAERLTRWQQAIVTDILTGDCPFGILEHIQKHAGPDLLKHVLETPGDDDVHELANARVWSASMHNLLGVFDTIYLGTQPMTIQEQLDRLADQYRRNPATRTPEPSAPAAHKISYHKHSSDEEYKFSCTCGAHWTLGANATQSQLTESVRSHQISVGLAPSVTL